VFNLDGSVTDVINPNNVIRSFGQTNKMSVT
jgi:hypothetical protein